jgi:hypothetical protein
MGCEKAMKDQILSHVIAYEAVKALDELFDGGLIFMQSGSRFSYLIDGCVLTFPIAKRLRGYSTPHWLPVYLRPEAIVPAT